MRLISILAPCLAASAFAAPGHHDQPLKRDINIHQDNIDSTFITARHNSHFAELSQAFDYASTAMGCGWQCVGVVLQLPCILEKISAGQYTEITTCAPLKTVCNCLDCSPELEGLAQGFGVCLS
ncbi:hypothetical protein BKA66DRAFT_449152 [Pyrenochaeta sp. MPI-SDFR-AT-0127]|nr:hypothetical protein BKA66DRAFT_449152 [Pyrenochaeta sp. MPI-SDFR-AT-0127]